MAVNEDEVFDKALNANLQRVLEFLKYAEAKNGVLLTLSSAWIIAICGFLLNDKVSGQFRTPCLIALMLFIGAGVFAMASFLPRLHLS